MSSRNGTRTGTEAAIDEVRGAIADQVIAERAAPTEPGGGRIPFPPPVAAVLGQLTRQIALLAQQRDAYVHGALAMAGVEEADVDWDNLTYRPRPAAVAQAAGP
jgi:hypothetical protein